MPTNNYPIPDCPKCGKRDSKVLNTYYTNDNQIIRHRQCNFCTHRLYTEQPGELALNPDVWRVIIPKFIRNGPKRVEVRHKSNDAQYRKRDAQYRKRQAARANDQQ